MAGTPSSPVIASATAVAWIAAPGAGKRPRQVRLRPGARGKEIISDKTRNSGKPAAVKVGFSSYQDVSVKDVRIKWR